MTHVNCRTCGEYLITGSLLASRFPLADSERHRFSFWCKRRQLEGRSPVPLAHNDIDAIVSQLPNPKTHEKTDILLQSLALLHQEPGKVFEIDFWRERSLACANTEQECSYFYLCLRDRGDLKMHGSRLFISGRGWDRVAELSDRSATTSKTAFVAMMFTAEMQSVCQSAIAPAIKRAGFEPRLANEPAHNEQIDARIVAELKQSRFVVADVTGARTGVYFEAGYALGLGRPVIWTCRDDSKKDMHFDTRQYNHILWKGADDLAEQLFYRIAATI